MQHAEQEFGQHTSARRVQPRERESRRACGRVAARACVDVWACGRVGVCRRVGVWARVLERAEFDNLYQARVSLPKTNKQT